LKKKDLNASETIFIDDNKDNIAAAQKIGIIALLYTDLETLKNDLGKYGII